jgi:hypothetical protein
MNVSVPRIGIAVNPQFFPNTFRHSVRRSWSILYDATQKAGAEASIERNSLDLLHKSGVAIAPFDESLGGQDLLKPAISNTLSTHGASSVAPIYLSGVFTKAMSLPSISYPNTAA